MNQTISNYSFAEELTNAITHGVGALLSVAALTLLVTYAAQENDLIKIISFSIYGASLILMFLMSTLYHAIFHPLTKQIFKLCDHCAIYVLIAGTYTPLMLVTLKGTVGYIMCSVVWAIAAIGIFFKVKFKNTIQNYGGELLPCDGAIILGCDKEFVHKPVGNRNDFINCWRGYLCTGSNILSGEKNSI